MHQKSLVGARGVLAKLIALPRPHTWIWGGDLTGNGYKRKGANAAKEERGEGKENRGREKHQVLYRQFFFPLPTLTTREYFKSAPRLYTSCLGASHIGTRPQAVIWVGRSNSG